MPEFGARTAAAVGATLIGLALTGCSDSIPLSAPSPATPAPVATSALPASPAPVFGGSLVQWGKFVPVANVPGQAQPVQGCNLDAIYNAPPGSGALDRRVKVLFTGWLVDADARAVPAEFELLLRGVHNYAMATQGGNQMRADVAAHFSRPELESSGYRVMADLSAVSAGEYAILLSYAEGGKRYVCAANKTIEVQ